MRIALIGALTILFTQIATAQPVPDLASILRQVSQLYSASEYEMYAVAQMKREKVEPMRFHIAVRAPDRYRMEGAMPGADVDPESAAGVIVCDGANIWMYMPATNEYGAIPLKDILDPDAPGDLRDVSPQFIDGAAMWRYRGASKALEPKLLREETIDFGGQKVDCYVVALSQRKGEPTRTWWIENTNYRVLREDDAETSTMFTSVKIGKHVPDSVFKFDPPPGARKVEIAK